MVSKMGSVANLYMPSQKPGFHTARAEGLLRVAQDNIRLVFKEGHLPSFAAPFFQRPVPQIDFGSGGRRTGWSTQTRSSVYRARVAKQPYRMGESSRVGRYRMSFSKSKARHEAEPKKTGKHFFEKEYNIQKS